MGLIYPQFGHFGRHTGWPAVVPHLSARVDCMRLAAPPPIRHASNRALDWVVRPRGVPWYTLEALGCELAAARLLRTGQGAICHFLYGEGAYHYLGRWRARSKRPRGLLVSSFHQPPGMFEHHIGRSTRLDMFDAVIVQASNQVDQIARRVPDGRLFLVPHGVDTNFFVPSPVGRRTPTLLCVGSWLRDFTTLREVTLRAQYERPTLRFRVVANPGAARELVGLRNVELVRGLSDRELLASYQSAAALLLPLRDATANNALLEAMACGLPVIATRVGGVPEYVDGRGAELVAAGDAAGLWRAAVSVLDDPVRAAAMGAQNRARVMALDWQRIADVLVDVYAQVCAASARRLA